MIFGPGFYHERSILTTFKLLQHGLPIPLPAADAPVSFVSARDAAQAFELASLSVEADGESFNVAAPDKVGIVLHGMAATRCYADGKRINMDEPDTLHQLFTVTCPPFATLRMEGVALL